LFTRNPGTFWSFKHALIFGHKKAGSPPRSLDFCSFVAYQVRKRLADLNVTDLKGDDLAWAHYVFVSARVVQGRDPS
jgi:hypothetical protein